MDEYFVGIFENDKNKPLSFLKEECDAIDAQLINKNIQKEIIQDAGVTVFMDKLAKLQDKMTIFHFSGHHGADALQFSDDIFNDKGLTAILNKAPRLKMVFINGCATQKIVEALTNVPVVIGTADPVYDHFAKTLSTRFYELLLNDPKYIQYSDFIENSFLQARGFQLGNYYEDGDKARGIFPLEKLNDRINRYLFKINKYAKDFEQRVTYNFDPDQYEVNRSYKILEKEIKDEEELEESLYQYYPYFICIHLRKIADTSRLGYQEYQKLSFERYATIKMIFKEFFKFLHFSAYSVIWTISRSPKYPDFMDRLSDDTKKRLRENLTAGWKDNPPVSIIENLAAIYQDIPDKYIKDVVFFQDLKSCVLDNIEDFKKVADFIFDYFDQNGDAKLKYLRAESYLKIFLKRFKFLRQIDIESVYDVYYSQFMFTDQPSYFINKSFFPVDKRPDYHDSDLLEEGSINKDNPIPDINIHSVYIYQNDYNNRVLNMSPFYIDVNSSSLVAEKIKLYYLDMYAEKSGTLSFLPIDDIESLAGNSNKIKVALNPGAVSSLTREEIEVEEQKKIISHFNSIKELFDIT